MHGEALVGVGLGERPPGQQVVLVGGEDQPSAQHPQEALLGRVHDVDHDLGLGPGGGSHPRLGVVAAHAQGDDAQRRQLRVAVEHAGEGVGQDGPVVDPRAADDLPVHLDVVVEQRPQPAQRRRPPPVPQQVRPDRRVGGVDADVERADPLGDDPLQVGLGEAGQGGEVPVEEAQPVVVVLEVEALPQPRRQLVDEAELAVVVAGADLVEQRAVDLDAERLAGPLGHLDGDLQPTPPEVEHRVRLVGEPAPLDDVAGGLAVDGQHLVVDQDTGPVGRRTGDDGDDAGRRHDRSSVRGTAGASPGPPRSRWPPQVININVCHSPGARHRRGRPPPLGRSPRPTVPTRRGPP